MKYDPILFKVKNYIRQGSLKILSSDVDFNIKRHVREHYIGLSSLTACGRLIWAKYYCPGSVPKEEISDQSYRIFDLGHVIEDMTLKIMKEGGADIDDGQLEFSDFGGIVKGHADSVLDREHILEIKSMNQHSFDDFTTLGVRFSHPTYYAQVQMYMHYSGLNSAVLVATNKNTSQIECEVIYKDEESILFYLKKLRSIIDGTFYTIDSSYIPKDIEECKFCSLYQKCHPKNKGQ